MKAIVTGMIATYPVGGVAWDYAQYILGLRELGFDVYYVEDTGLDTYDPPRATYSEDPSFGVAFLESVLSELAPDMENKWFFRGMDGSSHGLAEPTLRDLAQDADLFLNVSGSCLLRPEYVRNKRKVLIDTDPGWNQMVVYPRWDQKPGWLGTEGYRSHDHFFSYAERISQPDCPIPDLGIEWIGTRPIVVSSFWAPEPPGADWTTVMTWTPHHATSIEHDGVRYGSKQMEFARIEELPRKASSSLELAIGGEHAPVERWRSLGWSVINAPSISADIDSYRSYIQRSRGEFSVAKNVYVATNSGWFSCRSVCYLAASRPVVVQDTGFSDLIPTGAGLMAYADLDQAVRALDEVEANYQEHQEAAKELAGSHFSSARVLGDLLERVGLG